MTRFWRCGGWLVTGRPSSPRASRANLPPIPPNIVRISDGLRARMSPTVRKPTACRRFSWAGPTPHMMRTGLESKKLWGAAAADDDKPFRFVKVRGDLGQRLVVTKATET